MDKSIYEYKAEKNLKLLEERGIGFEDVITILETKGSITILETPDKQKYPQQSVYVVNVNGYAYLVPFEQQGDRIILKTIYPSRRLTKRFQELLQGGKP
jgi:uncharacterized DUF497 family protein